MYKIIAFTLLLFANNIFAATASVSVPTITTSVAAGTTFKFTETLSGKLPAGYKVKIDLNNGKGLVAMTCSGMTCTLSSNALPKNVNSAKYRVGIYDAKGILQGYTINGVAVYDKSNNLQGLTFGNYVIATEVLTKGYSKISNTGNILLNTAALGSGADEWACTKDNKTGLMWEVKTTDGGLRDKDKLYTNYTSGYPKCDYFVTGSPPCDNITSKYGAITNTDGFIKAVNAQNLCGVSNWRLPVANEVKTLIFCSDGNYYDGYCTNYQHAINEKYFPNINSDFFWLDSIYDQRSNASFIWKILFGVGYDGQSVRENKYFVMLVN